MNNQQAQEAGKKADDIIKNLANPSDAIVTEHATVKVLDKAQPVEQRAQEPIQDPVEPNLQDHDWKERFGTYKSSTDKTLHDLRQKVNQFDILESQNEDLKKKLETTQAQIPSTPNEMLELFSQEEVDGFTKMLDGRVGGLQGEVERLQGELNTIRKADAEVDAQNIHQSVINTVAKAVPNYKEIDVDPLFSEWMQSLDGYGNLRYDMLVKAKNSSPPDIGRIVQFYVDFTNTKAANAAQAQEEPTKQYTQQELLQNPSSTSSSSPVTPKGSGIVWDQATISQFYKDKAVGKINPKQAAELEKDMYFSIYGG